MILAADLAVVLHAHVEQVRDLHDRRARLLARGGTGRLLQTRIDELSKRYEVLRGRPPIGCFCRRCCSVDGY